MKDFNEILIGQSISVSIRIGFVLIFQVIEDIKFNAARLSNNFGSNTPLSTKNPKNGTCLVNTSKLDRNYNNNELLRKVKLLKQLLNNYNEIIGPLIVLCLYEIISATLFHIDAILKTFFEYFHVAWAMLLD